jgi:hypothetical protein
MKDFRLESAFARNNHSPKSPASLKKYPYKKIVLTLLFSLPSLALADTFTYVFITGDKNVGHLIAETNGRYDEETNFGSFFAHSVSC